MPVPDHDFRPRLKPTTPATIVFALSTELKALLESHGSCSSDGSDGGDGSDSSGGDDSSNSSDGGNSSDGSGSSDGSASDSLSGAILHLLVKGPCPA